MGVAPAYASRRRRRTGRWLLGGALLLVLAVGLWIAHSASQGDAAVRAARQLIPTFISDAKANNVAAAMTLIAPSVIASGQVSQSTLASQIHQMKSLLATTDPRAFRVQAWNYTAGSSGTFVSVTGPSSDTGVPPVEVAAVLVQENGQWRLYSIHLTRQL